MDIDLSLTFLLLIVAFLWDAKADLFFMAFGTAVLLYMLIQFFFMEPIDVLINTFNYMFLNPLGIITLFIPLLIYGIRHSIKRVKNKKCRFSEPQQ
ncbi:MAG: hypothetical protein ACFFEN_05195 [Candidatus Thorarchaeota archaeon]